MSPRAATCHSNLAADLGRAPRNPAQTARPALRRWRSSRVGGDL
jgi:hypothetical protein